MCGRFTQHYTWAEVHAFLNVFGDLGTPRNLQPRYNIAPTTFIDVVVARVRNREIVGREIVPMRWGLIPDWWKKPRKDVPATFNARAETVAEKPMFRGAFKYRRCIIQRAGSTSGPEARAPGSRIILRRPTVRRCWPSPGSGTAGSIPTTSTR
jgi:putative SOS response-associated peptidase YedK